MSKYPFLLTFLLAAILPGTVRGAAKFRQSQVPPTVPVGLDAYRMWDNLPLQRIGVRAYMRSTYDRTGGNRTADASHFLYQEADDFNVTLDVAGSGILYFVRTNHWHGSPWHYEVDGNDFLVSETATADPVNAKTKFVRTTFIPQNLFPNPLVWTWSDTKGADLMWVPLAFEDSLRLAYSRTYYGTGYYIYHLFGRGTKHLSQPIKYWDKTPPDTDVLDLLNKAGTDIAPKGQAVNKLEGNIDIRPHQWQTVAEIKEAPATIRALKFNVPRAKVYDFGQCRLRITWDNRWFPSVDAPVALFFGAGHLYNSDGREYLVKGLPMVIRYDDENVYLNCYYPMPFFKNARIEIEGRTVDIDNAKWEIRTVDFNDPVNTVGYFHATYSDYPNPVFGEDMVFLDTAREEGSSVWSGSFVGMSWIFTHAGRLGTLEGDPRFFFDDSLTPQGWGTGTEEWGGGGDYWGGRNMTLPLAGHPVGVRGRNYKGPEIDLLNSAYRFLIADLFPFGRRAVVRLEHGAENDSPEHYEAVVYWYGLPSPSLVLTDTFHCCDPNDAKSHDYKSETASEPYTLVSRYELGPDHLKPYLPGNAQPTMIYPAQKDEVRTMTGVTEFKMKLITNNLGVMLRRKFDYKYPNQRAKVYVRDDDRDTEWQYAGDWYTAGSNTCVYSYPKAKGELGAAQHKIVTGNRRWREEEFLIGRDLTAGIRILNVKLEFVPNTKDLYPDRPFGGESAWSEARYWAYCYTMPKLELK